ncbi:MAG: hypothetical protein ACM3X2_01970 [Pseudomonadota bacterium]
MKSEPKPFASLSSGLLARKGGARPAMRPQGFGQIGGNLEDLGWNDMGFEAPKPAEAPRDSEHDAFGEPIAEHPALHGHAGLTPVNSPVHTQQAEIEDRFNEPEGATDEGEVVDDTAEIVEEFDELPVQPVEARAPRYVVPSAPAPVARRAPSPRAAPGSKGKAAFTLRLDPERHLKLRLACALNGRSAQLLVTDALDLFLDGMPELEAMAEKAKRNG